MKCIILAAGYGTRLHPVTLDKPKAFVEVAGKYVLDHIIEKVEILPKIDEILIVTNNKFFSLFEKWKASARIKKTLKIINDNTNSNSERLGALGDLLLVIESEKLVSDILLVSSDNLFDFDLNSIVAETNEKDNRDEVGRDYIGVYEIAKERISGKHGAVEVHGERVVSMQEKPLVPKSNLASIGIYLFRKSTLPLVRKYKEEGNRMDAPGYFLEWLPKRKPVYAHIFKGKWFDIGSVESLAMARKAFGN